MPEVEAKPRAMRVNLEARAQTAAAKRERTRERLLDAAMAVIAQGGVEAASIDAVVAAAGVARGTFYNYFPNTGALVHALLGRVTGEAIAELSSQGGPRDPAARFAVGWRYYLARAKADPVWGWSVVRLDADAASQEAVGDQFRGTFLAGVERGRFRAADPAAAETLVFGTMRMAMRDVMQANAPPGHGDAVLELVLIGLGLSVAEARRLARPDDAPQK